MPFAGGAEAAASDPSAESALLSHLAACSACRAALREIRANNRFLPGARLAYVAMKEEPVGSPEEAAGPAARDVFPGYEVQEEIHRGGQGIVYRAVQVHTQRTVAIKMLLGGMLASSRQRERFEREVRIAASLQHPNIVTIYDSGAIADGRYGLAMEYIDGRPLDQWSRSLDGGRSREARREALRMRLAVMVKVCDAVLCAHQHAIVHRDLKPANILVDGKGEPHVLDFGIARSMIPDDRTRITHTGEFAGTLAYASPEQVSGDPSRIDTRSDIYSLGVMLYELVSGRMPYPVDTSIAGVVRSIESFEPARLTASGTEDRWIDREVSTIILKAMAKDPARRYATAAGLRNDLKHYLAGEAIEARRDSTWYVIRKTAGRHRLAFGSLAAGIIMLAAFGAWMTWQAGKLSAALSTSNIERGRVTAMSGDLAKAQDLIWAEFLRSGGSADGFSGSATGIHAYWALWDTYRHAPCIARFLVGMERGCAFAFFADEGRSLCAVTRDGSLLRWSVPGWLPERSVRTATVNPGVLVQGVATSDGGKFALFGGGAVRIADARTGNVIAEAPDPDGGSTTGAFSPDGTRVATIGRDGRLRLRDASSLATIWESQDPSVCEFSEGQFCEPAYTPDGALIAAARPDGSVGFWDAGTGDLVRVLAQPESVASVAAIGMRPSRIAFSQDGGRVAASMGTHVIVWRGEEPPADLIGHKANVAFVAFVPGQPDRLYSAGRESAAVLWDLSSLHPVHTYDGASRGGLSAALSPDGRWITMGSNFVRVIEAAPEPFVSVLHRGQGPGGAVAVSHSGKTVALARGRGRDQGPSVLLIDLESRRVEREFSHPGTRVMDVAFAPDDQSLYASEEEGRITQWDLATGAEVKVYTLPEFQPRPEVLMGGDQMRLSPDGKTLACADGLGLVGLWETEHGAWIGSLKERNGQFAFVEFSRDGTMLLTNSLKETELWSLKTREVIRTFPRPSGLRRLTARFAPDGRTIAQAVRGDNTEILDLHGRRTEAGALPGSGGLVFAFHPSGRILIGAAQDQSVRLWDTQTSRVLLSLAKHEAPVISIAVTPDGHRIISSDLEGTVLVWDLTHFQEHIRREWEARTSGESR